MMILNQHVSRRFLGDIEGYIVSNKLPLAFSGRARLFSWFILIGGLATFGLAMTSELQGTGRRSNEPPVPARGKLGQDLFIAIDHRDTNAVRELLKEADAALTKAIDLGATPPVYDETRQKIRKRLER